MKGQVIFQRQLRALRVALTRSQQIPLYFNWSSRGSCFDSFAPNSRHSGVRSRCQNRPFHLEPIQRRLPTYANVITCNLRYFSKAGGLTGSTAGNLSRVKSAVWTVQLEAERTRRAFGIRTS